MRRIPWRPSVALALAALAALACVSPRIEVQRRVGADLSGARTIRVLPAEVAAGPSSPGSSQQDSTAALAIELQGLAERGLVARGYRAAGEAAGDLQLTIEAKVERVSRRTWSSDPDASALRDVELEEAVVVVRAYDGGGPMEALRVEARSRLPERALPFAPDLDGIYSATLAKAIEAFPVAAAGR